MTGKKTGKKAGSSDMSENTVRYDDLSRAELAEKIAELVLTVPGVSGMSSTLSENIKYIPGVQAPVRGVHIGEDDGILKMDLFIIASYGTNIPQTAWDIQTEVKGFLNSVGITELGDIDIHVQGVFNGEDDN